MAATSARLSQLAQPDWNLTTDRLGQKHQRDRISVEGQRQNGRSASGAADGAAGYHNVAGLMHYAMRVGAGAAVFNRKKE
jgi:hypothetical protein